MQHGKDIGMNDKTQIYRQIHPNFVSEGRASSRAFRPSSKDPYRLSVYDGDQITAEAAWLHYTTKLQSKSSGVMAVTVNECKRMNLCVVPDRTPYKEHAFIDFGNYTKNQIRKMSKQLRAIAQARDWLFFVDSDTAST